MGSKKVLLSSIKMVVATLISRVLGLVREQVMAYQFGASSLTDAFLVAYRIPNLLRDLFAEGAFSAAFVPSFIKMNRMGLEEGRVFLWRLFILLSLITTVISAFTIVFAPEIISVFAPSFEGDKLDITVTLTRIMSPFLIFVSIAALFMGALNSLKVFFIPSLPPAFFNLCMIICMLALPSVLIARGLNPIYSLGAGVFIGGLIQALVQLPFIIKKSIGPKFTGSVMSSEVKRVFKKLGPGLVGFAATQINLVITTILATGTVVGAVSWLSYAFRLFQLPVGILGVSIGNSNLIHFGDAWTDNKREEAMGVLSSSFLLSVAVMIPAALVLHLLSVDLVNLIFQRGAFSESSTLMTAKALRYYAIGLPFYGIYKILVPVLYTVNKEKVAVTISIISIALNLAICLYFTPIYGFQVLALGTSLSIIFNATFQFIYLYKNYPFDLTKFFNLRYVRIFCSAGLSYGACLFLFELVDFFELSFFEKIGFITLEIGSIFGLYGLGLYLLGEKKLVNAFLKKLLKR